MGASISASSMRMDPISVPLIRAMAHGGSQTLTVAPEAGSERLRNVINKTQTEEQMMQAVRLASEFNFPHLKLYFMTGHPTETDDDIQALIDFTLKARQLYRRRLSINATPFVPKAHTPFQWEGMMAAKELKRRQRTINRALARHGIEVRADSPEWAEVQAVLSRGDRGAGECAAEDSARAIEHAHLLSHDGRAGSGQRTLLGPVGNGRAAAVGDRRKRRQRELFQLRASPGDAGAGRPLVPARTAPAA